MRFYSDAELMKMSDNEIKEIFLKLRAEINSARKNKTCSKEQEIYYCYVCREIQRRPKFKTLSR